MLREAFRKRYFVEDVCDKCLKSTRRDLNVCIRTGVYFLWRTAEQI